MTTSTLRNLLFKAPVRVNAKDIRPGDMIYFRNEAHLPAYYRKKRFLVTKTDWVQVNGKRYTEYVLVDENKQTLYLSPDYEDGELYYEFSVPVNRRQFQISPVVGLYSREIHEMKLDDQIYLKAKETGKSISSLFSRAPYRLVSKDNVMYRDGYYGDSYTLECPEDDAYAFVVEMWQDDEGTELEHNLVYYAEGDDIHKIVRHERVAYQFWRFICGLSVVFAILCFMTLFYFDSAVRNDIYTEIPITLTEKTPNLLTATYLLSDYPLTIKNKNEPINLHMMTTILPVNGWSDVEVSVYNDKLEYMYALSDEFWRETGYDEGPWDENKSIYSAYLTFEDPGNYYFGFNIQTNTTDQRLKIRVDQSNGSSVPYRWLMLSFALSAVLSWLLYRRTMRV